MISEEMEQLVKLFDFALSSDNPAVKKALKNLLLLVSIIEPEEGTTNPGPLSQLQNEIIRLRKDVELLKIKDNAGKTTTYPSPYYPSYPPNTHIIPGGTWITTNTSGTSSASSSMTMSALDLNNLTVSEVDHTTIDTLIQEYRDNLKDNNSI